MSPLVKLPSFPVSSGGKKFPPLTFVLLDSGESYLGEIIFHGCMEIIFHVHWKLFSVTSVA